MGGEKERRKNTKILRAFPSRAIDIHTSWLFVHESQETQSREKQ